MSSPIRLGLVQLAVSANKPANLTRAAEKVKEAAGMGAQLVALPECFNSPYGVKFFPEYAEPVPDGPSCQALSKMARDNKVFLVGGSIPERSGEALYNTATVWSPDGEMLAKFRKIHLFDIDVPGKIKFKESDALTAGDSLATFELPNLGLKVGVGICYDIRFTDLARIYAQQGCHLLLYPGAFNMTTGPAHWELLCRGRAVDNQVYVGVVSPARLEDSEYVAWGHSTLSDPWGELVCKLGHEEQVRVAEVDLERLRQVRGQVPVTSQRRTDLMDTHWKKEQ